MKLKPRDFQENCVDTMKTYEGNAALIVMATGLGKTVTFCEFIRYCVEQNDWRCLILSHREELVAAPLKYLDGIACGVELATQHANHEPVISASIQSIVGRLDDYNPREIDVIIVDEAQHAVAPTYQKVLRYFPNAVIFGFTATPKRGDGLGLNAIFDDIIFDRNLKWGIENGYLCPLKCKQAKLKYKLEEVKVLQETGDFSEADLANAMSGTALGVAEIYQKHACGQTIIFAASVNEAQEITDAINKANGKTIARCILATTKKRGRLLAAYQNGFINVLVNFAVLTEGTDLPCTETILIAKPVAHTNPAAYAQMVGRGLRLYEGKEHCLVIDCVGASEIPLCTAATLIGKDTDEKPKQPVNHLPPPPEENKPLTVLQGNEIPATWLKNKTKEVDIMNTEIAYEKHDVDWFECQDGSQIITVPTATYVIFPPDENGNAYMKKNKTKSKGAVPLQEIYDWVYTDLKKNHNKQKHLWFTKKRNYWDNQKASEKQIALIQKLAPSKKLDIAKMTAGDASCMIKTLLYGESAIKGGV